MNGKEHKTEHKLKDSHSSRIQRNR